MRELYISIDIESDGPIPGPHSMLSLGAVGLFDDPLVVDEFTVNFQELEGAKGDPDTMKWWSQQPKEIWEACRSDPQPPDLAMQRFVAWVRELERRYLAKPVCVAYPAGFDYMFVYWYMRRFGQESPFSFSCIDMKTYAMAILNGNFRDTTKKNMPKAWFKDLPPHTHRSGDDALEQGLLFVNMLKHRNAQS